MNSRTRSSLTASCAAHALLLLVPAGCVVAQTARSEPEPTPIEVGFEAPPEVSKPASAAGSASPASVDEVPLPEPVLSPSRRTEEIPGPMDPMQAPGSAGETEAAAQGEPVPAEPSPAEAAPAPAVAPPDPDGLLKRMEKYADLRKQSQAELDALTGRIGRHKEDLKKPTGLPRGSGRAESPGTEKGWERILDYRGVPVHDLARLFVRYGIRIEENYRVSSGDVAQTACWNYAMGNNGNRWDNLGARDVGRVMTIAVYPASILGVLRGIEDAAIRARGCDRGEIEAVVIGVGEDGDGPCFEVKNIRLRGAGGR